MDRKLVARLALVASVSIAASLLFAGRWPKDQTVHYVLGDAAPLVEEVDARWARRDVSAPAPLAMPQRQSAGPRSASDAHVTDTDESSGDDWTREASFRYAPGRAPRVVTHEPRLPDGDYTVDIEIVASSHVSRVRRRVALTGGVASIDLADSVPR
jgi:hypothetical protein